MMTEKKRSNIIALDDVEKHSKIKIALPLVQKKGHRILNGYFSRVKSFHFTGLTTVRTEVTSGS